MSGPAATAEPPVDVLVRDVYVVTMDDAGTVFPDGAIAIRGGEVVEVGPERELLARHRDAGRTIVGGGKIAIPGLTDAHFHTGQALMRGLLPELARTRPLRIPVWREYLLPFESRLSPEDVYQSGLFGYGTMLLSGTTAFYEAGGQHPEQMARAALDVGIRGIVGPYGRDGGGPRVPAFAVTDVETGIQQNVDIVEAFPPGQRVSGGMGLAQTATASPDLVTGVVAEARARGVKVHMHLAEGTYEVDSCLEAYGKRPVQYMLDLDAFDQTMHFAHAVLVGPQEVDDFAAHGPTVAHCPTGNYSIGWPPVLDMARKGVPVGLGTDGPAVSGSLDLFRSAELARVGQEMVYGTRIHTRFPARQGEYLRMAVNGGAIAMGSGAGVLTAGAKADVVLLSVDNVDAAMYPTLEGYLYDAASARDVHTVLVDGEEVVRAGELLTVDLPAVVARGREIQARIAETLG